jgi:hypothetical protein
MSDEIQELKITLHNAESAAEMMQSRMVLSEERMRTAQAQRDMAIDELLILTKKAANMKAALTVFDRAGFILQAPEPERDVDEFRAWVHSLVTDQNG